VPQEEETELGRLIDLETAETSIRKDAELKNIPSVWNNLGAVLHELGRFSEAHSAFQRALAVDPFHKATLDNIAINAQEEARRISEEAFLSFARRLRPIATRRPLIRIGGDGDGSYLLPDDFEGVEYCFSPGVGPSSSFEADVHDRFGIHSFLADASVDGPASGLKNFTFDKKFVGGASSGTTISLGDWMELRLPKGYQSDLLMQMDIEGSEYEVLLESTPDTLRRFRMIAIEFHSLGGLRQKDRAKVMMAAFERLLDDFWVVHIHPNNCCGSVIMAGVELPRVMEITFLRKDRDTGGRFVGQLPHSLDVVNVPSNPQLQLDPWFTRSD
jgi:tetratricopeptide (TPR) repeat protein